MEIKQLIDDYIHWLKKEITFEKIGEYYEIWVFFSQKSESDSIFLIKIL